MSDFLNEQKRHNREIERKTEDNFRKQQKEIEEQSRLARHTAIITQHNEEERTKTITRQSNLEEDVLYLKNSSEKTRVEYVVGILEKARSGIEENRRTYIVVEKELENKLINKIEKKIKIDIEKTKKEIKESEEKIKQTEKEINYTFNYFKKYHDEKISSIRWNMLISPFFPIYLLFSGMDSENIVAGLFSVLILFAVMSLGKGFMFNLMIYAMISYFIGLIYFIYFSKYFEKQKNQMKEDLPQLEQNLKKYIYEHESKFKEKGIEIIRYIESEEIKKKNFYHDDLSLSIFLILDTYPENCRVDINNIKNIVNDGDVTERYVNRVLNDLIKELNKISSSCLKYENIASS